MKVDVVLCRECKHFHIVHELHMAKEICDFWGGGCKTIPDGYCFAGEKDDAGKLLQAVLEGRSEDAKKIAEEINSKVRK